VGTTERFTETWNYNGYFGASRDIELTPGVLDEAARDVFCRGHCHSLALALADLTDGELVAVYSDDETVADHILVRLPDGRYLDADGVHEDEDDVTSPYGWEAWLDEISGEEIFWLEDTSNYRRSRPEDALPFARSLIAREAIETRQLALA
jgi:hypothetical protein